MEKVVKIKQNINLWQLSLMTIVFLVFIVVLAFVVLKIEDLEVKFCCCTIIAVLFSVIVSSSKHYINQKEYLSEIHLALDEINLIYKKRGKTTRIVPLKKNNIQLFKFEANIEVIGRGRYSYTDVSYKFLIDLIEGEDVDIRDTLSEIIFSGNGNYNFVFKMLEASKEIPNFEFNLATNKEVIRAEIDYHRRFGKKIPMLTKLKISMNDTPFWVYILIVFFLIVCLLPALTVMYASVPTKLSYNEQKYLRIINDDFKYAKSYDEKIRALDKAKSLISTDPHLYCLYAAVFMNKKDYYSAIDYAKQGIANLGNKEVYNKRYKLTTSRTDIYLYEIMGNCYTELQDWQKAIEAYNYVAKSKKKNRYSDVYYKRGNAYLHLGKYKEAKKDFLKQKSIVSRYIKDPLSSQLEYYKQQSEKNLSALEELINTCDERIRYSE